MTSNSQSTKSLGQVAYEAHTPDYRVQWDDLWLGHRKAWQAAAEAVADEYGALLRREIFDVREKHGEALLELDRWRAVIEAAKALHAAMIQSYDGEPVPLAVMVEFKTAVEALQEAEGGD